MNVRQLIATLTLVTIIPTAFAQSDRSAAEAAANGFLQRLDSGDPSSLYQTEVSPRFKANISESAFIQNIGMIRIQLGGPAATRKLIGSQALDQIPGSNEKGSFYYIRYHAKFPIGSAFQDTYLEKVSGTWKMVGFWNAPAPQ